MEERVDRRILGAVEMLDVTTERRITAPLMIDAQTATLRRTRLGLYAILHADGLEEHTDSFDAPPPAPAEESVAFEIRVRDPRGRYLERRATLRLPRTTQLADPLPDASLFRPIPVTMFASPAGTVALNWAVVRASVRRQGANTPLAGALVLVREPNDGPVLARGVTDSRGEALAAVEGIPVIVFNPDDGGPVTATEQAVEVFAFFDPEAAGPPDPDDLESRIGELASDSSAASLATGREVAVTLSIQAPG